MRQPANSVNASFRSAGTPRTRLSFQSASHPAAVFRLMAHRRGRDRPTVACFPACLSLSAWHIPAEVAGSGGFQDAREEGLLQGKKPMRTFAHGRGKFVWPMSSFSKPTD